MKTQSEMSLTNGNLFKKVLKFTIPLMLTSIFQLLYSTIDLWTVSNFGGGPLSMSSIGSNSSLIWLIITLLMNLSIGSNVSIGIAKGSQNKEKAHKILHTSYAIAIVGGFIFGIIGFVISPYILEIMDTPDSIINNATLYLRIYFAGLPFLALYNFGSQMLRALGDSKRPMYFLIIAGLINIIFDLILVIVFNMDVAGVAFATIASEAVSAILVLLWFAKSKTCYVNLNIKEIKFDKETLKEILKIGVPAGIQGLCFTIPNLMIQSSLYDIEPYTYLGQYISQDDIISGSSASSQIEGYVFAILDSFAMASVSFTGQNYGYKSKENIKKCYWYCLIWMTIFWAGCTIICFAFNSSLLGIFIKENKDIVVKAAKIAGLQRMTIMVSTYILDGVMDLDANYLKGLKKSIPPAIVTLLGCCGIRILWMQVFFKMDYFHTITWLYAAFPISWIINIVAYIPIILIIQNKQFKKISV